MLMAVIGAAAKWDVVCIWILGPHEVALLGEVMEFWGCGALLEEVVSGDGFLGFIT